MNKQIQTILDKEVSRKEFLGLSGLAIASVMGFGGIIKLVTGKSIESHQALSGLGTSKSSQAYGSSPYGGKKQTI